MMSNDLILIELSKAGGTNLPTGTDMSDWRKTSKRHKTWEKGKNFFRRLQKILSQKNKNIPDSENDLSLERHHDYNGRPWCLGRDHVDYLIRRGLKCEHRLLDLGCGALRTGVWIVKHLDADRYFGIDAHRPGLEAAVRYEIPLHGLEDKKPRLLHNDIFDIAHFGVEFDWIFAFAVINHLPGHLLDTAFREIHRNLKPSGRLILSPCPRRSPEWIEKRHNFRLYHSETTPCKLMDDQISWFEFQPVTPLPRNENSPDPRALSST